MLEDKRQYTLFSYLPNHALNSVGLRPVVRLSIPSQESVEKILTGINLIVQKIRIDMTVNIPNVYGNIEQKEAMIILNNVDTWYYLEDIDSFVGFSLNSVKINDIPNDVPINVMLILREHN